MSVREAAVALSRSPDDYTEQGTAVAFADAYADALCWQDDLRWVAWDGTRWAPDAQAEATLCMMRFTDEMMARAKAGLDGAPMGSAQAREAEAALRWAVSCRSATRIGRTLRLAQALMKRHALSDFDADPWLLNTPGGMVDLRTGRMRPHDPAALCTAITHLAPAPDADAPRYTQFLYRITGGDGELCDYLQRVAGMALVGEVYEEGITICHGPGGNGKSTLFGLWQDVLGDYAGTIRPELLVPRARQLRAVRPGAGAGQAARRRQRDGRGAGPQPERAQAPGLAGPDQREPQGGATRSASARRTRSSCTPTTCRASAPWTRARAGASRCCR